MSKPKSCMSCRNENTFLLKMLIIVLEKDKGKRREEMRGGSQRIIDMRSWSDIKGFQRNFAAGNNPIFPFLFFAARQLIFIDFPVGRRKVISRDSSSNL